MSVSESRAFQIAPSDFLSAPGGSRLVSKVGDGGWLATPLFSKFLNFFELLCKRASTVVLHFPQVSYTPVSGAITATRYRPRVLRTGPFQVASRHVSPIPSRILRGRRDRPHY